MAEYRRETLAAVVDTPPVEGNFALELVQGDRVMPLRAADAGGALSREVVADYPFGNGHICACGCAPMRRRSPRPRPW